MKPIETGNSYNVISSWWSEQEEQSTAGVDFVSKALGFSNNRRDALDVGCGSGGRLFAVLLDAGFQVTGIDVSEALLNYARKRHPDSDFILADICEWQPQKPYDFIIAWDSIFHAPYSEQRRVVEKLCNALAKDGVILFTAGGVDGEITGQMGGQEFYYSSLTENEYLKIMRENGCKCFLMERDQHPEDHVVFIGAKG